MTEFTTFTHRQWEYCHFIYPLGKATGMWVSLAADWRYTEPLAREFFWQIFESQIAAELLNWQREGWELVEPASPRGLRLHRREYIDKKIDLTDIMIWIATFGMVLLPNLLLGFPPRRYVAYEPLEFCALIQRPISTQQFNQ